MSTFSFRSWQLSQSLIASLLYLSHDPLVFLSPDMRAENDEVILNVDIWYAISREVSATCRRFAKF